MCNRVVQKGRGIVKPGQPLRVLLKGPGAEFELEAEGVFIGCARENKLRYWTKIEGGELAVVPDVEQFGEKHQETGAQSWESVPPGTTLQAVLLPAPAGKEYRPLKIVTTEATPEEFARWGNDRAPVLMNVP